MVLNGQSSDWPVASASVSQGSVLGPLFFFLYLNDLPENLSCKAKLFADGTSLFSVVKNERGTVRAKTKTLHVVENVVKPQDLKCFCSHLCTSADIPCCFSHQNRACARPPFLPFCKTEVVVALMSSCTKRH